MLVVTPTMSPRAILASLAAFVLLAACSQPLPPTSTPTPTVPPSATVTATADLAATTIWATTIAIASGVPTNTASEPAASATRTPSATATAASATPTLVAGTSTPTNTRTAVPQPAATRTPTPPNPATPTPLPTSSARLLVFTANPDRINPGEPVDVYWEIAGTRAELCALGFHFHLTAFGCQTVPLSGTLRMTTTTRERYYARYLLRAYDDRVPDAFVPNAEIAVPINCPDTWMTAGPPAGLVTWNCPAGPARVTNGAAERFEHGGMYWLEEPDMILVYGDSGGQAHVADLPQGQPDFDPAIIPPPGYYQPVRGFGLVWRGLTVLGDMRGALGWAIEPERQYTFRYQCNASPDLVNEACLVLGPDGYTVWWQLGWSETMWP